MKAGITALLATMSLTAACSDDDILEDEDTSVTTQSIVQTNSLTFNRIAINRIAINRIAINRIAINRISGGRFALDKDQAGELLTTPEGRELLDYVVGCALTANQSLEADHAGTTYTFTGDIGLGRNWVRRELNRSEQRWVSACLLSRVNANDIALLVSLRGPTPRLGMSAEEAATYTVEEGSFYGNVFGDPDEPLIAYACRGRDQALGEPGPGSPLGDRDCTEVVGADGQTKCEFTYTGDCMSFDDATMMAYGGGHDDDDDDDDDDDGDDDDCDRGGHGHGHHGHGHHGGRGPRAEAPGIACEDQSMFGGFYKRCHTTASDANRRWPRRSMYREVITVYLTP